MGVCLVKPADLPTTDSGHHQGNLMNRCFLVLCILASVASAHIGTRVFPFYELTDEMLETIDIHDRSVEEWYQIGEPSMTLLDFKTGRTGRSGVPDPSDLDFRIWLAWHDESNRIYTAVTTRDDVYYNEHNHNEETERYWLMLEYDSILFSLDADHSGGTGTKGVYNYVHEELLDIYGSTQWYSVIAQTQSGPTIDNRIRVSQKNHPIGNFIGEPDSWMVFPPYGDAGGMAEGEQPSLSVIEMYVTPYDGWGALDDPDQVEFSELSAHQIIGFVIMVFDSDGDCHGCTGPFHQPAEIFDDGNWLYISSYNKADDFIDGLLLPAQDTSVESITWGRIKASLQP